MFDSTPTPTITEVGEALGVLARNRFGNDRLTWKPDPFKGFLVRPSESLERDPGWFPMGDEGFQPVLYSRMLANWARPLRQPECRQLQRSLCDGERLLDASDGTRKFAIIQDSIDHATVLRVVPLD